jgi:hypothetical protein
VTRSGHDRQSVVACHRAEEVGQGLPLRPVQCSGDSLVKLPGHADTRCQQVFAGRCEGHDLAPAICRVTNPLDGAEALQMVDERDHEAGCDVHDLGKIKLGTGAARAQQRKESGVLGFQPMRGYRLGELFCHGSTDDAEPEGQRPGEAFSLDTTHARNATVAK